MTEQLKPFPTCPACGRETSKMLGFNLYQCQNMKCIASCAPPQAAGMFSRPSPWVPVSERLPEIEDGDMWSENVLVATEPSVIHNCIEFGKLSIHGYWSSNGYACKPTHWMPLPPAPETKGGS